MHDELSKKQANLLIQEIGYHRFIRLFLKFLENEILSMSWYSDFYQELRPAWDFLHGKITKETLYEFERNAFENSEKYDEVLEQKIANMVANCLRVFVLTSPYTELKYDDKFLGMKREYTIIIDSWLIISTNLNAIDEQLVDKCLVWIKAQAISD